MNVDTIISFAQYNEDLILRSLLFDVKKGFYIDIGANHPQADSVTKLFYDKGWNGINIEPIASLYNQLVQQRPKDINLAIGVGQKKSKQIFREYTDILGHSTFDKSQKEIDIHKNINHVDYEVEINTLQNIIKKYANNKKIDFLKIDVEGYEYEVIVGNDWNKFRPKVLCIESNHVIHDWRPILNDNNYRLFIYDGLNEYYIANEEWQRTIDFAERSVVITQHSLKQHQWYAWERDLEDLRKCQDLNKDLTKKNEILNNKIEHQQQQYNLIEPLSLKNISLRKRIYRAVYGLTIDWLRFKKQK